MNKFFQELKRRNVFRVGVAYIVVSWVALQFVDVIQDPLALPEWFQRVVIVLLAIGFPIALIISWAFEMTPQGLVKTAEVDKDHSITPQTGRKIDKLIIGGLALAVVFLLVDRFAIEGESPGKVVPEAEAGQVASIAVLPFLNLSGDPKQNYFSEGMSEEILDALVKVNGLSVASRTSAFAFKGENLNIPQIAKDLKVDYVIEGSVRRSGDTVRITAQLIDGSSDRHLWSNTYDRQMTDIFKIQDDISHAIVAELGRALGLDTLEAAPVEQKTENMSAYDAYLKGRNLFITRSDLTGSIKYLEQAVALDKGFAGAWETLAAAYSVMPSWGYSDRPYFDLSNQAADRAIALDSKLSLAYAVKGNNLSFGDLARGKGKTDWIASFELLDRAIANDPKNTTAYLWRGINYMFLGFPAKAVADTEKCLAIDPAYLNCKRHQVVALVVEGKYAEALKLYQESIEDGFPVNAGAGGVPFAMVKEGNDLAAVLFWRTQRDGKKFPVRGWLDAVKNRGADHSKDLATLEAWRKKQGFEISDVYPAVLGVFGAYDKYGERQDFAHFAWWPRAHAYRQTKYFKELVSNRNYLPYWRKFGFPKGCRAVGDDDFECE